MRTKSPRGGAWLPAEYEESVKIGATSYEVRGLEGADEDNETGGGVSSYLVVIYGTSDAGKDAAWALGRALPGKSAVLSLDKLLDGAIARAGDDAAAELDMVQTQVRLLVANYMKNGYNVVLEGAFYYRRGGELHRYEQDIDQLIALMRQMTRKALAVHLQPDAEDEFEYKQRYGATALGLDATKMDIGEMVEAIRARLEGEEIS